MLQETWREGTGKKSAGGMQQDCCGGRGSQRENAGCEERDERLRKEGKQAYALQYPRQATPHRIAG